MGNMEEIGIESSLRRKNNISLVITEDEFLQNKDMILQVFRTAEEESKR